LAVLGGLGLLAAPLDAARSAEELPRLGVTLPATSVSGLSSGAYMAGQIELAHSKDIVGAGIVAGGPFACAETESGRLFPYWPIVIWQNASQATNACMKVSWGVPDVERLAKRAKELAEDGKIDALSGLADDKVYLFSGDEDQTVQRPVVEAAKRFYAAAGVPEAGVTLVERQGGHAFLTETEGTACGLSKEPFVSDCDYDQAKAILEWIYGAPLADPLPSPTGKFIIFDQSPFSQGVANGLAAEGVVYVPKDCESNAGCRLHIALHGCEQARETVGDAFIKGSGFAPYADTNRLVILFPQIAGSMVNPNGCWDWWGYSDIDYLGKDAPQIAAIWAMAERLAAQP
ncbi:MAG TPA: poly(3-hydroxybutyrate) depolymerase, partial [Methyloceanibacter sp.]|nr:poly(3-hydroxybutyrate) depolymerase [Methyloceanibacter sp.]